MNTTRISLLLRIKDLKDADAWAEFDAIYRPILSRFAAARGLQEADVDDVVQHCMTAIHAHIKTFEYDRRKGQFKAWLRTMVDNRVKNLGRKRRERVAESGDLRRLEARELAVEEVFDQVWMEEHLKHALRLLRTELDETTFIAFEAYAVQGRPAEAVCRELGVGTGQLYKLKWRVTRKLGEIMKTLLEGTE